MTMLDTARTEAQTPADRPADDRVGLWLVGARGSIGTTVAVGLHVIANEPRRADRLHDGRRRVRRRAAAALRRPRARRPRHQHAPRSRVARRPLADSGMIPPRLVNAAPAGLEQADAEIRPGYDPADARPAARPTWCAGSRRTSPGSATVTACARSWSSTSRRPSRSPRTAPSSTTPPCSRRSSPTPTRPLLPASAITALAAIESGSAVRVLHPLDRARRCPRSGRSPRSVASRSPGQDGKTGETLLRTAIAPMFVARGMHVHVVGGREPARRRRRRHPGRPRGGAQQARLEDPRPAQPRR